MSSFARKHTRRTAKAALTEARRLHALGVTSQDLQRAAKQERAIIVRGDRTTARGGYPCDVCGRKSAYYRKWGPDDLRRRGLPPRSQHLTTHADTWCWWHAPLPMWPKWRKVAFIGLTFLLHPIRFLRARAPVRPSPSWTKSIPRPQGKAPKESTRSGSRGRRGNRLHVDAVGYQTLDRTRLRRHQLSDFLGELQHASFVAVRNGDLQHACNLAGTACRLHFRFFRRAKRQGRSELAFSPAVNVAFASGRYSDHGR